MSLRTKYLSALELSSCASPSDIKTSYRKLARKYHPDKTGGDVAAADLFKEIAIAYEMLTDPDKLRAEELETAGAPSRRPMNSFSFGSGEAMRGFSSSSAYTGSNRSMNGFSEAMKRVRKKPPTASYTVFCSLEQLAAGCVKKLLVRAQVFNGTRRVTLRREIKVNIRAGHPCGKKITFKETGNQQVPNGARGDIDVIISQERHRTFQRDGDDLIYIVRMDSDTTLPAYEGMLTDVFGMKLAISVPGPIEAGTERVLRRQGMPSRDNQRRRGDLIVRFTGNGNEKM